MLTSRPAHTRAAFTMVEILIVVVILAILAMLVIPQLSSAAEEARDSSVQMSLHRLRTQLEIYQAHHGQWPALATFEAQMTLATNAAGQTAALGTPGYIFGPYVREIPVNPNTGGNTLGAGAAGSSDWYYNETTGDFRANESEAARQW